MRNPDTQIYNTVSELVGLTTSQTYPSWATTSNSWQWTSAPQMAYTSPWTDTSEWPFWPFGVAWTSWGLGWSWWVLTQDEFETMFERSQNISTSNEQTLGYWRGSWLSVLSIDITRIPTSLCTRLLITLSNWYGFIEELEDREFMEFEYWIRRTRGDYEWVDVDYLIDLLRDIRKKPQKSFTQWFIFNNFNENEKSIKEK